VTGWNPRYLLYARSLGLGPEAARRHGRVHYPGGCACGFILWIDRMWSEWRKMRGLGRHDVIDDEDHADFDAWLATGRRA